MPKRNRQNSNLVTLIKVTKSVTTKGDTITTSTAIESDLDRFGDFIAEMADLSQPPKED